MPETTQRERLSRVLLVEDDASQRLTLTSILQGEGFEVLGCATAAEALVHLQCEDFAVAVVDLRLPDLDGTVLLEKIDALNGSVRVIINTAYGSFDSAKEAVNRGAFAYVEKASDPSTLIRHVHAAYRSQSERYASDLEHAVAERTRELRTTNEALRRVAEGVSVDTGDAFFHSLVQHLAGALAADFAFVGQVYPHAPEQVETVAVFAAGAPAPNFTYSLAHTPCANVMKQELCVHETGVARRFPQDRLLAEMGVDSYAGTPLVASTGEVIGLLVVLGREPMRNRDLVVSLLKVFATRAASELERQRAERALQDSEARYRAIVEDQTEFIVRWRPDGTRTFVNEAYCRYFGQPRDKLIGSSFFPLIVEADRDAVRRRLAMLTRENPVSTDEHRALRPDGTTAWQQWTDHAIFNDQGRLVELQSVGRDITERKQAEELIRAKTAVLEGVTRVQRESLAEADPSQSFERMLAFLLEMTASEYGFIGEVLRQSEGQPYLKTHAITDISWNDETRAFYKQNAPTGLEFYNLNTLFGAVMTTGAPVVANDAPRDSRRGGVPPGHPPLRTFLGLPFFHGDELIGMVGLANRAGGYDEGLLETLTPILATCSGLTHAFHLDRHRRQAEQALRDSEARYRAIVEDQTEFIVRWRPDGTRIFVNEAYCRYFGEPHDKLVGTNLFPLIVEADRDAVRRRLAMLTRENPVSTDEHRAIRPDGTTAWQQWTDHAIFDDQGRLVELQSVGRDITERKQAQEAIRKLNEDLEHRVVQRTAQLQAANKELEAFTYSVSHDLRAPVRHVDGFARILLEECGDGLGPAARQHAEIIVAAAAKMGALIDNLLDLSRIGRKDVTRVPVDSEALVRDVWDELGHTMDTTHVTFSLGPLPVAQADPALLRLVWANLLGNAVKYSATRPTPEILVDSRAIEGRVWYRVQDNGVGFDPRYADKLFGVFQRLHRENEFPGTGVGLAIVERIVHKHGGGVTGTGEVDRGATFEFALAEMNDGNGNEHPPG